MHFLIAMLCLAADIGPNKENPTPIRVVPVSATPESSNVKSFIVFPKGGERVREPVELQMQVEGFPLGTMSNSDRKSEIYNDPNGQSVRVMIDNYPYLSIYTSFIDSLDDNNIYYEQTLNKVVPYNLGQGPHVLRVFPVRSFGESLKGKGCFAASLFYVGGGDSSKIDLNAPFLTYNTPQGQIPYNGGQPVLLDFYISNARLSRDGYKVRLTVDGHVERVITNWVPYYLYGLSKGTHTIRLELLDSKNAKVSGNLNDVQNQVTLY